MLNSQRQTSLLMAAVAGLCWAMALILLLFGDLAAESEPLAPQRALFYGLSLAAPLLTFGPVERNLDLTGLTVEGTVGTFTLLYCLAFVPAPRDWLLALHELPVYTLLLIALFLCGAAITRPFIHGISVWLFRARARAFDSRRVRRQAYEAGFLAAMIAALAGLRVLTWVSLLLLVLALILAELLFLAQVPTETGEVG